MTTEKAIQEGIQGVVRGISAFEVESVQINNDIFLDGPLTASPFINILDADNFSIRQDTVTPTGFYETPAIFYVEWTDWQTAQDGLRDHRQSIIDKFSEVGTARSAGGIDGVNIEEIRADGPVTAVTYSGEELALPVYLMQSLIFVVQIYG